MNRKLITIVGTSDNLIFHLGVVNYYNRVAAQMGGVAAIQSFYRFYLIPGMTHCGGGPALEDFDPLTALEEWVEQGAMKTPMMAASR